MTPEELFRRCLALEPTDGIAFPGIALVDHRRGLRTEMLGPPPPLAILGVDPGGTVRTADFNRWPELSAANSRKEPAVQEAVALAKAAIASGDSGGLAMAATLSALAHQAILPNPLWEHAEAMARACGALGINVAHSGTVVGILFDPRTADLPGIKGWLEGRLGLPVHPLRLTGGGVIVSTDGTVATANQHPGGCPW